MIKWERKYYKPFRDTNLFVCVCFWSIRHILDKCHKWSAWIMLWFIWNWFMNYLEVGCAWNEKFTGKSIGGIKSKNISICLSIKEKTKVINSDTKANEKQIIKKMIKVRTCRVMEKFDRSTNCNQYCFIKSSKIF